MNIKKQLEELKEEYASKQTAKHNTLNGYFYEIENLHTKLSSKRLELFAEKERRAKEQKQFEKDFSEKDGSVYYRGMANYEEYKKENALSVEALQTEALKGLADIRGRLEKYLDSCYLLDGKKIDEDTVRLLQSGIRLSVAEIEKMLLDYDTNATMTRVLCDYADSNNLSSDLLTAHRRQLNKSGVTEMEEFDFLAEYVTRMFSEDDKYARLHCDPKYIEKRLSEVVMDNDKLIFSADN